MKTKIKKYIRKYIPVIFTLLFIPILSINTFAYQIEDIALTGYTNAYFLSSANTDRKLRFRFNDSSGSTVYNEAIDYNSVDNSYILNNATMSNITQYYIGTNTNSFDIIFNYDLYDYYIYISCHTHDMTDTFSPNRVRVRTYENEAAALHYLEDLSVYYHTNFNKKGFSVCGKLPDGIENTTISVIDIFSNSAVVGEDIVFEGVVFAFNKGSETSTNQIVTAINNQTSSLGGKLDGIDSDIQHGNDLIDKGNESTGDVVQDFNEVFEDFNSELENIEEFDNSIISEFESANEQYLTELNNFSLSASLLNAGNWLSTSMQTVYDNSSDYKMLWLVPLLLGIPLIILFLKKGSDD